MIIKPSKVSGALFDTFKYEIVSVTLTERDFSELERAIIVLLILLGRENTYTFEHKSISEQQGNSFKFYLNEVDFSSRKLQEAASCLLSGKIYDERTYELGSFMAIRWFRQLFNALI